MLVENNVAVNALVGSTRSSTQWVYPSLARRMSRLLADDPLRQEMGRQGRQRVLKDFSFAHQAERYRQLFAQAAGMV